MKLDIVSANRLSDGRVVYLAHGGQWSENLIDGRSANNAKAGAALLAEAERAVADCRVIGPHLVPMCDDDGAFAPIHYRERIRQLGPSA